MTTLLGYIHDRAAFASLLHLERMRSDRSDVPFALAVFSFGSCNSSESCARFTDQMRSMARATDHTGWMSPTSVGVILWNTSSDGAWHFVDKATNNSELTPDNCDVFVYPPVSATSASERSQSKKEYDSDGEPSDGTSDAEPAAQREAETVHPSTANTSSPATLVVEATETLSATRIRDNLELTEQLLQELLAEDAHQPQTARQTQPLESLFVRPLPVWKRAIDIVGASCGLLILSPLFLMVAAAIKLTSPGPVFFSQMRSGRGNRPFPMFKFRSMVVDAEARKQELMEQNEQDGPAFKMENDPRITPIGHLIRRTSIDELPQLWNVLRGDMSIVGPRPLPCSETDGCSPWQRRRLDVTPGLTCIWQVQDRRTKIPFAEWARMDIRYIKSRTLRHDMELVLRTFRSIFGRKGS